MLWDVMITRWHLVQPAKATMQSIFIIVDVPFRVLLKVDVQKNNINFTHPDRNQPTGIRFEIPTQ